jgi:tight adherence protein C
MDSNGILALSLGALVFLAILVAAWLLFGGKPNLEKRARQQSEVAGKGQSDWQNYLKISWSVLRPLGEMIPRSPDEMSRQEQRLTQAGIRRRDGAFLFMGAKVGLAIALILFLFATGFLAKQPFLCLVVSPFLGALIPDIWLNRKIAARKDRIQLALPDALDLMVLCVEAGLGLDQALNRIGQELRGGYSDLSDELQLYSLEVTAGKKRDEALRNLGQRSDTEDLKALANALIQANRFGVAIAQSLRVFSDSMRVKRRQRLEERAAKMSTKMIPVLVFFILPAIFVVEVGPAFLQIVDTFGTLGK